MFSSSEGACVFDRINNYVIENNMSGCLEDGVLVGFSGGPDSVMLLSFLYEYRRRFGHFNIAACHINHMIRGEDANLDEQLASRMAEELSIEFIVRRIDVPTLAKDNSIGIEECARNARYSTFADIIRGRNDIKYIATAHNIGDTVETALFNIIRGAGALGASGISPKRDNIIRPMLSVSKSDIFKLLDSFDIPYSIDKTNLSSDYTRNFIRNELLTRLGERFPSYERSVLRFTENMRDCYEYINSAARAFVLENSVIKNTDLLMLYPAVLSEVLSIMADERLTRDTVFRISALLEGDNFSYDLPKGRVFVCERGECRVADAAQLRPLDYRYELSLGLNEFKEFSSVIYISEQPIPKTYPNIYKIAIQDKIPFDIIYGVLFIRPRKVGDTIFYGGMTHKIKKMLCDRKVPNSKKDLIPIFCDDNGPILVPGYHSRDGENPSGRYLYVYILDRIEGGERRFLTGKDFL